jgi:hypothetical protein
MQGLSRRNWIYAVSALGVQFGHWVTGAIVSGCSGDAGIQRRVRVQTWSRAEAETVFSNAHDYEVRLDSAELGIEHLYFVTGDPVGGALSKLLNVRSAHAHPGHYAAGETLGEMTEHSELDLLGKPVALSEQEGVTGEAHSCVLRYGKLGKSNVAVRVSGEAVRGEHRVRFRGAAVLSELLNSASDLPEVPGVMLEGGSIEDDGRFWFSASPRVWLDQVDFSKLTASNPDDDVPLDSSTQPHNAFVRGVLKAVAYHVTYETTK